MFTRKIARNIHATVEFNGKTYHGSHPECLVYAIANDLGLDGVEPATELVCRTHTNTVTFYDHDEFWADDNSSTVTHELAFTVTEYDIIETAVTLLDGEGWIDRPFAEIKSEFFDLIIDLYDQYNMGEGLALDSDGCVEYTNLLDRATVFDIERGLFRVDHMVGLHIWIKHTSATADRIEALQQDVYESMLASEIIFDDEDCAA